MPQSRVVLEDSFWHLLNRSNISLTFGSTNYEIFLLPWHHQAEWQLSMTMHARMDLQKLRSIIACSVPTFSPFCGWGKKWNSLQKGRTGMSWKYRTFYNGNLGAYDSSILSGNSKSTVPTDSLLFCRGVEKGLFHFAGGNCPGTWHPAWEHTTLTHVDACNPSQ